MEAVRAFSSEKSLPQTRLHCLQAYRTFALRNPDLCVLVIKPIKKRNKNSQLLCHLSFSLSFLVNMHKCCSTLPEVIKNVQSLPHLGQKASMGEVLQEMESVFISSVIYQSFTAIDHIHHHWTWTIEFDNIA
jgi:hypothetical protein